MRVLACLLACLATTHAFADVTPANVATLTTRWEALAGGVTGGAILRDGRLYVGAWDGRVTALDPATGAKLWSTQVKGPVPGSVLALDDGGVCYGTFNAEVGCLNGNDGSVRWKTDLNEPGPGAVWSAPIASHGRLYVGVASQSDQPCIRGRLVALDQADGHELWRFYTIPEKVCDTDTTVACTANTDCPDNGSCIMGRGAGVTATPALDPTGEWIYMNTVGCYTFPSIGESDSMFKIEASTGDVAWRNRVDPPEQFGMCQADTGVECGVDGDCAGVGGTCQKKAVYHDFGFLNGPVRAELPDGMGGTKVLIISGSKNGTLYAFDEATGDIVWANAVRAEPVSPGLAGFGLFNGAIELVDGRIYAALNSLIPVRVCSNNAKRGCSSDADCPGATCPPEKEHLMTFDAATGDPVWSAEIGRSWSHVAVANGIVYAGTNDTEPNGDASWFYAHDAATGARLATFNIPYSSIGRAVVTPDTVYVALGLGQGGIRALSLLPPVATCSNRVVEPGEECDGTAGADAGCCTAECTFASSGTGCGTDDGNACTTSACDGAGACVTAFAPAGTSCGQDDGNACTTTACNASGTCVSSTPDGPCDDGDACTNNDRCAAGSCTGTYDTLDSLGCALARLGNAPCGDETVPKSLDRAFDHGIAGVEHTLARADTLAGKGKTTKVERLRRTAMKRLQKLGTQAERAVASHKAARRISAACGDTIGGLIAQQRSLVGSFVF